MISFQQDSIEQRWRMLEPHVQAFGPDNDEMLPAVLLFHGCAGVRPHIELYARKVAEMGLRSYIIDSYAARGWNQAWATTFVCAGAGFWGRERAGDVLAAAYGIRRLDNVDETRMALAGWSHGSWSIMDLMTMPLERTGEAGLLDPSPIYLEGVKSLFLAYPYGGVGALCRSRSWVRGPETLAIVCEKDHITGQADALRVLEAARQSEAKVQLWIAPGTHAFDSPGHDGFPSPMRYDPDLASESMRRFERFIDRTLMGHQMLPTRRTSAQAAEA